MKTPPNCSRALRVSLLLAAASALARIEAAEPAPAARPPGEDVSALSPFEVSTSQDTGYQTTDTLAGSRLRTNVADIASSVHVFTSELLSDIGATNEFDVMRYSAAAEVERTDQTPVQGILPRLGF